MMLDDRVICAPFSTTWTWSDVCVGMPRKLSYNAATGALSTVQFVDVFRWVLSPDESKLAMVTHSRGEDCYKSSVCNLC